MKYSLRFRPEIPDDIIEACRWYENCSTGLSERFLHELNATLSRIALSPESYGQGEREVRSARMRRFPYIVHFRILGSTVVVLAVLYGGRDSSVLQDRT